MKRKLNAEEMYATMNPWRLFFVVALPGLISMLAMSLYNVVEGVFIGQILGESAFAAVNIALPLVMINFSIADLIGVGASAPISIALGRNDRKTANNIFTCSIIMIFVASAVMGIIMFSAAKPLARMMGADDALLETSVKYLRTYAVCSPLATIFFAMDNFLRISGFVKTSMTINVGSNISMVLLLFLFLIVCRMDVSGCALAVSLSMCGCSVVAMIPFVRNKALLKFTKPKFSASMFKQIAACGSPVFLSNISGRITAILINVSLMTLGVQYLGDGGGTTAVAAYGVLLYVGDLCQPMLYGIADALSPALGYNWGACDYDRVKKIARCAYTGTALVGFASTAMLYLLAEPIASLFVSAADAQLLKLATHAIKIFCFTYVFRWITVTTQSYLSAIEKPLQATILSVGIAFVLPVALLALLRSFGLDGIWFNNVGVNAIASAIAAVLLVRLAREIKRREKFDG